MLANFKFTQSGRVGESPGVAPCGPTPPLAHVPIEKSKCLMASGRPLEALARHARVVVALPPATLKIGVALPPPTLKNPVAHAALAGDDGGGHQLTPGEAAALAGLAACT